MNFIRCLRSEVAKSVWVSAPLADNWGLKVTVVKAELFQTLVG
ncbi:MAG: hypothetical protein RMY28_007760 [Nostoc sp. ChiSLP01]